MDQALERAGAACRRELAEIAEREARDKQRVMELVRDADDRGDWKRAGYPSSAAWFAQAYRSDHRTAVRVTETSQALRELPALEAAMSTGSLTFDQITAATKFATPATDAELARIAVGKAPSEISLAARTLAPPKAADDQELHQRRSLRMTWTSGKRELAFSGRLPLEQGVAFEQAVWNTAKADRAEDKQHDTPLLEWQQYTADALVTLATRSAGGDGVRRSPVTVIIHRSPDRPPFLEGAGPVSAETADRLGCDARRLEIELTARDLVHSRIGRCASYAQQRALHYRSKHCQYPGCTAARELEAHHLIHEKRGGKAELANLILLCPRHHKLLHDHHITTSGTGDRPAFADRAGRAITTDQPHAPPR